MDNVIEYKCPNCGGILEFNAEQQKMVCPYCDSAFATSELQGQKADEYDEPVLSFDETYIDTMKHYICTSCGGEIDVDENSVADFCPFCSRPVIMNDRVSSFLKPDYVIPFKINREQAVAKYSDFSRKYKRLVPKEFLQKTKPDNIKGIYVPYWLYSADTETHCQFEATIEKSWTIGKTRYTKTDYYNLYRTCENAYDSIPSDGSSHIENEYTESIEPYNYEEKLDFETAFLSGYFAEKYDQDDKECYKIAYARMKNTDIEMTRKTISGYDTVTHSKSTTKTNNNVVKYALMPVWLMSAEYKGKKYQYALNGQTGKFVGKLPVSKGRVVGLFAEILGIALVASGLISFIISRIAGG